VRPRFEMPHPAVVCSGPQLMKVIEELEAGTYPQPEDAVWRDDLPLDLAVRLARATGATSEQITEVAGAVGFYVTVQRQARGGLRTGWLLGPYETKEQAEEHVPEGKILANQADPRTAFDAFGTSGMRMKPGANLPQGVLNERLAEMEAANA
jgi:hypothetical protein